MNSRISRAAGRIALATALTVIVAVAHTQGQANPEADFKKVADDFSAAWNKGDAAAIAALHTEDALRLNGDGTAANGRAAIQQGMTEALGGVWKGTRLTITAGQSKRVTDDVVCRGREVSDQWRHPSGWRAHERQLYEHPDSKRWPLDAGRQRRLLPATRGQVVSVAGRAFGPPSAISMVRVSAR
ncbi:MAG: SgcJ/EcaC family oxidoreductase, partial [Acidobacteria bacterium]|nr:SgcJ/EcaC family oxidoreductase [Acidobacteriota bacterium]